VDPEGQRGSPYAATVSCPSCGTEVVAAARFCPNCGFNLHVPTDERRVVTVLFGDLVGFTGLAETRDPEQVKNLIDRCFARLAEDIRSFGGSVDKVIGDAVVALFGAPVAHEDDAERAVRAALQMQLTLADEAAALGLDVQMRIGVNTGEVLVGAIRAGGDYTAMGDVVNTASRLETIAEPGTVVVGPDTYAATADVFRYEPLGLLQARGREGAIEAWRAVEAVLQPGRRPVGAHPGQRAVRGVCDRPDAGRVAARGQRAVLLRRQRLSRLQPRRRERHSDPAVLRPGCGLRLRPLSGRREG